MPRRPRTDPRSPVQPDRIGLMPFAVLVLLALAMLWTLRDSWVSDLDPPYDTARDEQPLAGEGAETTGAAQPSRGNLTGLFSANDYPIEALRNEEQGTVGAELLIDPSGRVSECTVTSSSGSEALDRATCSILMRRARFTPARDENGRAVADSYTQRITWQLQ